jgi:hypothetical protein
VKEKEKKHWDLGEGKAKSNILQDISSRGIGICYILSPSGILLSEAHLK